MHCIHHVGRAHQTDWGQCPTQFVKFTWRRLAGGALRQTGEAEGGMQGSAACVGSTPSQACWKRQHGVTNLALSPEGGSRALQ